MHRNLKPITAIGVCIEYQTRISRVQSLSASPIQPFIPSVLWCCWLGLLTCKNGRPYNLYCVGADLKPCSINQSRLLIPDYS